MFVKLLISVLFISLFCFFPDSKVNAQAGSQVFISEINLAGSTRSRCLRCNRDKWVELRNPSNQAVSLAGWSLRTRGSKAKGDNIVFPSTVSIAPGEYYLIAYREKNLSSTLNLGGIQPDAYSGKIMNISNIWENGGKYVNISLLDTNGLAVSAVKLGDGQTKSLIDSMEKGSKYSIQPSGGSWVLSNSTYFTSNFGTPKSSLTPTGLDLDMVSEAVLITDSSQTQSPVPSLPTTQTQPVDTKAKSPAPQAGAVLEDQLGSKAVNSPLLKQQFATNKANSDWLATRPFIQDSLTTWLNRNKSSVAGLSFQNNGNLDDYAKLNYAQNTNTVWFGNSFGLKQILLALIILSLAVILRLLDKHWRVWAAIRITQITRLELPSKFTLAKI
jgi:Lamin Tail Domain